MTSESTNLQILCSIVKIFVNERRRKYSKFAAVDDKMLDISNKNVSLVFYIGSSEVRAAVVNFDEPDSGKPEVLFWAREPIDVSEGLDYSHLPELMGRALEKAGRRVIDSELWKQEDFKASNIHCVFSSLWYSSKVKNISFKGEHPFIFSEDILEDAVSQVKEEAQEEGGFEKELIIEQKGVQVKLNGYLVENPYHKEAGEVEVTVFLSSLSEKAYNRVIEKLSGLFNEREIYYHSFVLSNFSIVAHELGEMESFLMMDVGGEITEMLMVYDGAIQQIGTFPCGLNYFVRALSEEEDKTPTETFSTLRLFAQGKLDEDKHARVEDGVSKAREQWVSDLEGLLRDFSREAALPGNLYLNTEEKLIKWFGSMCKDDRLQPYTLLKKPFNIIKLNSPKVAGLVFWKGGVEPDNILAVCAGYIYRYIK